ncbi:ubiquinol-cytochrome c reductase cytochrome c subunit [Nocardioides daedukensis]|uniref:Cytochrome bc1 complex cytochrome c subunit n=1 Tax=Nocardioides daedukensis TaxID=634462 RepID=A0A7Y9UTF1_9ACTN|nr:ubiquinol-cytochrome c reductase cytochrome c subunit [Nocardioides daedukensis]
MRLLNRSAGRLSRLRRGPLAGLMVLLLGLLFTGSLYAMFSPAQAEGTSKSDEELIQEGRELFLVGCSFCHGQNGEGITSADGQYGPSLVGVGEAAVDFFVGTGRMPLQNPGQQGPAKHPVYDDDEILALSKYVGSLGPGPRIPAKSDYELGLEGDERQEAIVKGGQLFLANCSACHNFEGSGGAMPWGQVAPSLQNTSDKHIYEAMQVGPGNMDNFSDGNIPPEDKAAIIAYLNSLEDNPGYGGFGLGGLGPVSEGMFAWIGGIGGLVAFAYWIAAHTTRSEKKEKKA